MRAYLGLAVFSGILLAMSAAYGAAEPTVSMFSPLPGDSVISPSLCNPNSPTVTRGGDQLLAVWSDQRGKLGDMGTQSDIFGMRMDAAGNALDPVSIPIGLTPSEDRNPRACWNGSNWLVVWTTFADTPYYYGASLVAARVTPGGAVLDDPPLVLFASESSSLAGHAIGSDGTNWVVVTSGTSASDVGLRGYRVSPAGGLLDPSGVAIPTTTPSYSVPPIGHIAGANGTYLYTYTMWNSSDTTGDDVMGVRLNSGLQAVGQPFYISRTQGNENIAGLATDGAGFLALFTKPGAETYITDLWCARVSAAGAVLDPSGVNISRGNSPTGYGVVSEVEWNGTDYLALWAYNGLSVARITASGVLLDPGGTAIAGVNGTDIAVSSTGGFEAVSANNYTVVTGQAISAAHGLAEPVNLSLGAPGQYIGSLADNGSTWMTAFLSATASGVSVKVQGLAADGTPLSLEPVTLATGSSTTIGPPKLAWNGSVYLVVWMDTARGGVVGMRVDGAGSPVDAAPFFIVAGGAPSVGALGANFLVAFTYAPVYQYHFTSAYAIRVDGVAGAPTGPVLSLGGAFAVTTSVVRAGDRWLALWQQNLSHDNQQGSCLGVFVTADGVLQNPFNCGGAGAYRKSPVAAVSDDTILLAWADGAHYLNYGIVGRRMALDGTFLDAQHFVISNPEFSQYAPSAAWNGNEFVIAFNDGRNRTSLQEVVDARSDIYGARVTEAGALLDPDGFPIAVGPVQEQYPQVGAMSGITMFSASLFKPLAPHAACRLGTAYLYGAPDCQTCAVLSAAPASRNVGAGAGTAEFAVTLAGAGGAAAAWSASTQDNWITLTSAGGTGSGTIALSYAANPSASPRTGTITVTAANAANSPVDVQLLQEAGQPMTGSVVINNNRPATNSRAVTLSLTWAGGSGGVARMRFSDDGAHWSAWEAVSATRSYTLPPGGDGNRTVRVQFLDKENNRSAVCSDYIRLDTTPPTGTILINNGALVTTSRTVTLRLTWADGGTGVTRMRFSDDGANWTAWMPLAATRTHTLPAGSGYRTVRVQYLDGANNYSAVQSDYIRLFSL